MSGLRVTVDSGYIDAAWRSSMGESVQQALQRGMDRDGFLRWAEGREGRHELVRGQVIMMTGGSRAHTEVLADLLIALASALDRTALSIKASDFAVETVSGLRYPDIVVEPAGRDRRALSTDSPLLIAEVLSPSSIAIDMVEKAAEYKAIDSLVAYLVCSQDEARVWIWPRGDAGWAAAPKMIEGIEASVDVPALGIRIPLAEVYRTAEKGLG
jgi:Uma2 family endonuclease